MTAEAYPPISDYALISDCHTAALVSRDDSIDWCSFHRFEARPVFGRLLDWGKGGFFRIAPRDDYEATRRYLPGTNILETRFQTGSGAILLTDCVAVKDDPGHPDHRLIRLVRCLEGEVAVKVKFEPRFDYGLTTPRLEQLDSDLAVVYGGADALVLQTELAIGHAEEHGSVEPATAAQLGRAPIEQLSYRRHAAEAAQRRAHARKRVHPLFLPRADVCWILGRQLARSQLPLDGRSPIRSSCPPR